MESFINPNCHYLRVKTMVEDNLKKMNEEKAHEGLINLIENYGGENKELFKTYIQSLKEEADKWKKDELTGLCSKGFMIHKLSEELKRSFRPPGGVEMPVGKRPPVSVGMFDVDEFKSINDELGHLEGDKILSKTAEHFLKTLKQAFGNLRAGDSVGKYVGRYGGDEIMLVLPGTYLADALSVAERIRNNISKQKDLHGITASGGLTSSDVVGIPLILGELGRELTEIYVHEDGNMEKSECLKKVFDNYTCKSGLSEDKVKYMLKNIRDFIIIKESNRNHDPITADFANFEEMAVELITHYVDKALYKAKETGKNRIVVYSEEGFGSYDDQGGWIRLE